MAAVRPLTKVIGYSASKAAVVNFTQWLAVHLAHTPHDRFGAPEDLLSTLRWLVSPVSKFVSGTIIPVDGSFSAFGGV
jgi:NAD(P)-dependent dehydrogenase (short-subunit alcohol dehydrogenase family)